MALFFHVLATAEIPQPWLCFLSYFWAHLWHETPPSTAFFSLKWSTCSKFGHPVFGSFKLQKMQPVCMIQAQCNVSGSHLTLQVVEQLFDVGSVFVPVIQHPKVLVDVLKLVARLWTSRKGLRRGKGFPQCVVFTTLSFLLDNWYSLLVDCQFPLSLPAGMDVAIVS